MSPAKRFLIGFFGFALLGWLVGVVLFGPPGLSAAYMHEFHHEHEHYIEVIKSTPYKRWAERPHLHGPETLENPHDAEVLAANIEFAQRYESRPAFHAEQERIHKYTLYFEFFNPLLVVILVLRFARKPLLGFFDAQIAAIRARIEAAEQARLDAKGRLEQAAQQLASLEEERNRLRAETEERIARETAELEEANRASMEAMERELEDRKLGEQLAAERRIKTELLDAAIARLSEALLASADSKAQRQLVDQFLSEVERRA